MSALWVDIETFSSTDLKTAGVYRYAEDPTFEILMSGWSTDGETVEVAVGEEEVMSIPGLLKPGLTHVAHNAGFERVCFSAVTGDHYLPAEQWRDTAAIAAASGYPRQLSALAKALKVVEKDSAGTRLINLFCKPRKGRRVMPEEKPEEWARFIEYCRQDVYTLIAVDRALGGRWPTQGEFQVWLTDQAINDRGMPIDRGMAEAAYRAAEVNRRAHTREIRQLTGIDNPASIEQLSTWLRSSGLKIPNLQAETVDKALHRELDPTQRRVLELRQELALTASKKYRTALDAVNEDDRLRGGFLYHGAHTGRWAGRGIQPHNLPRAALEDEDATLAAILALSKGEGADSYTLKALVRALFVGPFSVFDYSAIEARVIAWLADELWALQAFRDGRDIYVETAERMGGLSRAQGKVAVLALGFAGGVGSLAAMGAKGSDEELQMLVNQWRRANPNIVALWKKMESAFRHGGAVGEHLRIVKDGTNRGMVLPSGRTIWYHGCTFGERITFIGNRGYRTDTYGGRLAENATQAVARDVLAEALVRLEVAGFEPVGHVHDEAIAQGTELDKVERVMTTSPSWASGLPIDGEGFVCERYRKG